MTDRPIIFSDAMVRALLAGRKTQTRRVIKPEAGSDIAPGDVIVRWGPDFGGQCARFRPRYAPGDRLYVREAHALVPTTAYRMSEGVEQVVDPKDRDRACIYRAGWERSQPGTGWRPSIHMPRWASRLTLTVTDVRVQRLQEISTEDCIAEGISAGQSELAQRNAYHDTYVAGYRALWNSLHGPDAWAANPWIVAVSFTTYKGNIDAA